MPTKVSIVAAVAVTLMMLTPAFPQGLGMGGGGGGGGGGGDRGAPSGGGGGGGGSGGGPGWPRLARWRWWRQEF
jgi:hypothetical protein